MSKSKKRENNHMWGKSHSEETKRKISKSNSLSLEIINQRREDIKNEPKIWGWKAKLAKKWNVDPSSVYSFIKKYASDLM